MISIIIPLYNKKDFIAKAIESVLEQTFTEFEILVVNDGSTDQSETIVESIQDSRLRLVSIKNSGVAIARNKGIELARYPWIAFLDADDWWEPSFLKEVTKAMKEYPSNVIFGTGRSRVFSNVVDRYQNSVLPENGTVGLVNYFKTISQDLPPINSSNVVISRELLIKKGLFKEKMRQHEDHDLWIRVCENNQVVFINKELSFYRKNIEDTASKRHFSSKDFIQYVSTIIEVNTNLISKDKFFFQKYYEQFITISYFQNCNKYTSTEKKKLYTLFKKLIKKPKYRWALWIIHNSSSANLYGMLKKLKGNSGR